MVKNVDTKSFAFRDVTFILIIYNLNNYSFKYIFYIDVYMDKRDSSEQRNMIECEQPSAIDKIAQQQRKRVQEHYYPLQLQLGRKHERPQSIRHHMESNGHHGGHMIRNKYNRMNQARQQHKLANQTTTREKLDERQKTRDLHQCQQQIAQQVASVDIDQLISEERELEMARRQEAELALIDEYERELQEYFNQLEI